VGPGRKQREWPQLRSRYLPSARFSNAKIRILVTDGFNTDQDDSDAVFTFYRLLLFP
jgi:hypothetical protein